MPVEQQRIEAPTHRSSKLRYLQVPLQILAEHAMKGMNRMGILEGTIAGDVLSQGDVLHANHITDSGLQMVTEGSRELIATGNRSGLVKVVFGFSTDMFDGPHAKRKNEVSTEGAMRDVLVDRVIDIDIGGLIEDEVARRLDIDASANKRRLQTDFSISMLTKAASEMFGVRSREGAGMGNMLHRRFVLFMGLVDLGDLNRGMPSKHNIDKTLSRVTANLESLMEGSEEKARERIANIVSGSNYLKYRWSNPALNNPNSSAANEASKYALVALMNQREGLDPVSFLNSMAGQDIFPTADSLISNFGYIRERVNNMLPFLDFAQGLIHPQAN